MKTKNEIIKLLTHDKRLRDSDSKLIARFWSNELQAKGIDVKKITDTNVISPLKTTP